MTRSLSGVRVFRERNGFCGIRALGWQLDYRPDGWLPLFVRDKHGHDPDWHILRLRGDAIITLGRVRKRGTK